MTAAARDGAAPRRRARRPRRGWRWRLLRASLVIVACGAVAALLLGWQVRRAVRAHAWESTARIWSAPLLIEEQEPWEPTELEAELRSRGYRSVSGRPAAPGEYRRRGGQIDVVTRAFTGPMGQVQGGPARLLVAGGRVASIALARDHGSPPRLRLEPVQIGALHGERRQARTVVGLDEVPPSLLLAIVEVEDQRFWRHTGVDPVGMSRALFRNLRAGEVVEGGSTITQQVVKNMLLTQERTWGRKAREVVMAPLLELTTPKQEILHLYLNAIYLGQKGSVSITGVGEAARFYFGRPVGDLTLGQAALLAGLIRSPGTYNPWTKPEAARARRDEVLDLLARRGRITPAAHEAAVAEPLALADASGGDLREAAWFVDAVRGALRQEPGEERLRAVGARIDTTLDTRVQRVASRALERGLRALEAQQGGRRRRAAGRLQGAVIVLDPRTGAVLALCGGRDHLQSQFNRAVQARRQVGSLIKPFVYLATFEAARQGRVGGLTAASVLEDEPVEIESGGRIWSPENSDGEYRGPISVRQALARSINVPAVRAAQNVGIENVAETAEACGFPEALPRLPSLALGAAEASPLEVATAFATLAAAGRRPGAHLVDAVTDPRGGVMLRGGAASRRAATAEATYLTVNLMQEAARSGTAARVVSLGFDSDVAGKTGTTNERRDAWFVGFTPERLALVWVGYDDNHPLGLDGAQAALPIWLEVAARAGFDRGHAFPRPERIVEVEVDPETGERATARCGERQIEIFIAGTEPEEDCARHSRGGFWRRLFGG